MTAKEFLSRGIYLDRLIKAKHEQIQYLQALQVSTSSVVSGTKRGGGNHDRLGDVSARLLDLIDEYAVEISELLVVKEEIRQAIERVKRDDYRLLLSLRYESFLTWERVAVEMGINWTNVHKKHKYALRSIEEYYTNVI